MSNETKTAAELMKFVEDERKKRLREDLVKRGKDVSWMGMDDVAKKPDAVK